MTTKPSRDRKLKMVSAHRAAASLRRARLASGKSMQDVAEACRVTTATISRWETATSWPCAEDLSRFAELVDLDTGDLFRAGTKPVVKRGRPLKISPLEGDLVGE